MDTSQMEKVLEQYEEIKHEAIRVFSLIYKDKASREGSGYQDYYQDYYGKPPTNPRIHIEDGMVEITWEESHCSCCSNDYYEEYFPTKYLFNDEWQTEYEAKIKKQEEGKIERERKATEKSRIAKQEADRKKYLELKVKFGGE